jgi:hypothetical protein
MQPPVGRNVEVEGIMRPVLGSWVSALAYCAVAFGVLWVALVIVRAVPFILFAGLFAASGFAYLYRATRATLDARTFGAIRLRAAAAPVRVGGRFQGSLRISESAAVAGTVRAELRCVLVWFEEGRREQVVWASERAFPIRAQPGGSYALLEFDIPPGLPPSEPPPVALNIERGRQFVRWEIQAIAEAGGAYRDELYTISVAPGQAAAAPAEKSDSLPIEIVRGAVLQAPQQQSLPVAAPKARAPKPVETVQNLAEPAVLPPQRPDRASIVLLVVANLVPLAGVAFWGWQVGQVVILYWMENLIVGGFNVMRILAAEGPAQDYRSGAMGPAGKLFHAGFFGLHYGGFCFVHGIFLAAFFGAGGSGGREGLDAMVLRMLHEPVVVVALLALLVSHGWSFFRNYIGRGEYERASPRKQMGRPYPRIIVVHVFILAGAFLLQKTGSPLLPMLLFIVLKTAVDLHFHYREHRGQSSP